MTRGCCTSLLLVSLVAVLTPSPLVAQHYGFVELTGKKTVMLKRRLAPAYNLHDTSFAIKTGGRGEAQRLAVVLQSEILKNGTNLQLNDKTPAIEVDCIVTSYTPPRAEITTRTAPVTTGKFKLPLSGGSNTSQQMTLTGSIAVSFQVMQRSSGTGLTAGESAAKLQGTYNVTSDGKHYTKSQNPTEALKVWHNTSLPIPSQEELTHQLLTDAAQQIAANLVAETQTIEVNLAQGGALDAANRRAEAGQWSPYLEMLEGTTLNGADDGYRRYDIGVANEALAYAAEDVSAARKFLEEASTAYNKALELKPNEKYLLEPQNRVQTAIAHYAELAKQRDERDRMLAEFKRQQQASQSGGDGPTQATPGENSGGRSLTAAGGGSAASGSATTGEVMTNDSVMKLVRAKFSEKMIVSKIETSARARFDTSVDAMVKLKESGVSDAEIQAMDTRMSKQGGER